MEEIKMQEWEHLKDLDCCKAWYINTADLKYDESVIDFGFELEGSSWNDLVQEHGSLVPLSVTEFPSMEGDLMEISELQGNPEEEMVFDERLTDCSSNWVCNELGAASKLTVQFSSGEEELGDVTDGLMVQQGKDFDQIVTDCSSNWVQRHCNELGAASKLTVKFSSGEEDLGDVTDGLMVQQGQDFDQIVTDCSSNWVQRHCNELGAASKPTVKFSSGEEDLGDVTDGLMVEQGKDFDKRVTYCSSNWVQRHCNELGAASKLTVKFSSREGDLGDVTDGLMVEQGKDFDKRVTECSSNWVQRHCNELGAASKLIVQSSSGEEDLGDNTDVLMVEEGKEEGKDCEGSGDEISVSNHYPTEAEKCSDVIKSMSSETGNMSLSQSVVNPCSCDSTEYRGLRLVHLLSVCAEAISEGSHDLVEIIFARLGELVSPSGSTMERVAYYLSQSLLHHHKSSGHLVQSSNSTKDPNHMGAFNLLNQVYPYIRFAHFTANQSILEAVTSQTQKVHIIDFDIMEGMQWPPLMEALKTENYSIDHLKITAIKWNEDGSYPCCSRHTGRRLSEYASSLGIPFSFQETLMENLERNSSCRKDETVIVNCMWGLPHMLERIRKKLTEFLDAARPLNPVILTVGSGPHGIQSYQNLSFVERFEDCMRNICAAFDSLEAGLSEQYRLARAVLERLFMAPLMCRPLHYSEHQQDLLFTVTETPLKCGFIQGNISEKNSIYAECMVEEGRFYRAERLGQNQLLLRWHSTLLTSISVWKATDLM